MRDLKHKEETQSGVGASLGFVKGEEIETSSDLRLVNKEFLW